MGFDTEVAADAPELWWKLHDAAGSTTTDDAANSHDGTLIAGDGSSPMTFGLPGLVAGGATCVRMGLLSGGDAIRSDSLGPSYNWTVEAVLRPVSTDHIFFWQRQGDLNGGLIKAGDFPQIEVESKPVVGGGITTFNGGVILAVGERAHCVWQFTGTLGVIGTGRQELRGYVNNSLIVASGVGTDSDYDFRTGSGWTQFSGWGFYVEHFIYYDYELTPTRIAAHFDSMGDVQGFGQSVESDLSGQIGYPRTFDLPQAGLPDVFDIGTQWGGGAGVTFSDHLERAEGVRVVSTTPAANASVSLGQASETSVARQLSRIGSGFASTVDPVPSTRLAFPPRRLTAR